MAGKGAHLLLRYVAPRIYVVAAPPAGAAGSISASVDGRVLPRIRFRTTISTSSRTWRSPARTRSISRCRPGTSLYSFTFG